MFMFFAESRHVRNLKLSFKQPLKLRIRMSKSDACDVTYHSRNFELETSSRKKCVNDDVKRD